MHLLRGPLRVTSVGSCLNAMPSGSTGGTSRSWQVINLTFAERAQTWQLLFPWASQLLFFTGKDLVTKWQNKGKVAVTHAILYVPVSPGQTFRHGVTWTCGTMLPWASHQGQSSRDTHFQSTCVVQFIYVIVIRFIFTIITSLQKRKTLWFCEIRERVWSIEAYMTQKLINTILNKTCCDRYGKKYTWMEY